MGDARGSDSKGSSAGNRPGWRKDDPDASDFYRRFLEGGERTRFKRKHPLPRVGDRFGELTVVAVELGDAGGLARVVVQCSCGAAPHSAHVSNLRAGKSTRCNRCAKKASARGVKRYWKYADVVPDDEHRRRLLNRIAACLGRCHRETDPVYANYGGRGIAVYEPWRNDRRSFLAYLVTLEGWDRPELELDRENVDRGYEPGNLRFITKRENRANRRSIQDLQRRVDELERRLRHCECGASTQIHDPHE